MEKLIPGGPMVPTFDLLPDNPGQRVVGEDHAADGGTHVEAYVGDDGVIRVTRLLRSIQGGLS